nr:alpha-glucosidase [Sphingomonas morindae]
MILRHAADRPALFVGRGAARVRMDRGNFALADRLEERIALRHATPLQEGGDGAGLLLAPAPGAAPLLRVRLEADGLALEPLDPALNRFWLRLVAEPGERLWGGGEQMSYVDMAGRRFPFWTSEPGIGRDKASPVTFEADREGGAGGDYWTTNYPQPTLLSSRRYALHVETSAYSCFDFTDPTGHEIEAWAIPARIRLAAAPRFAGLVTILSDWFGRPPRLPRWAYEGAIIGLKDGAASFARLETILAAGAAVSGLWCEDWVGVRQTSFGRRLFWDWRANAARYPDLPARIAALAARGIRFLGYVNPYLAVDGALYGEAQAAGLLALRLDADAPYHVDFGEFEAAIVDFTRPEAIDWFAERVIGRELLDAGLSGWMADFGEYLPVDLRLADGSDPLLAHNRWPLLWAEVNRRGIAGRGRTGDALFFMRAGFSGLSGLCPLLWAGDQLVDFSRHDGIGTVVRAALSAGLVGNAYHHGDLGGYTSLYGVRRTPELLMRWSELAAFTPVMRSHEGNRPEENLQLDQDATVLAHFARMSRVHAALAPYVARLCEEAVATGLPLQRPLFLDHEDDPACWGIETAYGYGRDLIVAPVLEAGMARARPYLPAGRCWIHLWTGACHAGGAAADVPAPLGAPPVFYAEDSPFAPLFGAIGRDFALA